MPVRTSGDLARFRSRVEALVHHHPVVVDNAYTRWFATGSADRDEVRHLAVQFSVFSHQFVEAQLRKVIDGVPNVETIGEYAFGTSLKSPLGSPSEKGRLGNVHFALGDNQSAYPGGQNTCRLHLDGVVRGATMQIVDTGQYIFKDGEWAL